MHAGSLSSRSSRLRSLATGAASTLAFAIVLMTVLFAALAVLPAVRAYADNSNAPVATDPFADATKVDLDDGLYKIDVKLEGGSGRATVSSPADFEVFDGRGVVKLVWSSSNYDYMVVAGKKYLPASKTGDSTFTVPVTAYDEPVAVIGDTTAMSEAHEVDYQLTVSLGSVKPLESGSSGSEAAGSAVASAAGSGNATAAQTSVAQTSVAEASGGQGRLTWPWIVFIVCVIASAVCIGITIGILRGYRNR